MDGILVSGPAGCGKTSLVRALAEHMKRPDGSWTTFPVYTCNLDPGSEDNYDWDVDIRDIFTVKQIMNEYGLGPNGAIVKAYEILAENVDKLLNDLPQDGMLFIDSPGQLEPFIFSDAGNKVLDAIRKKFTELITVFLIPGDIINRPADYAFLTIIVTGLGLKVATTVLPIISKTDLLRHEANAYIDDRNVLKERLQHDAITGELTGFALGVIDVVEQLVPQIRWVKVSITPECRQGLDDVVDLLKEARCGCGDLS